MKGLLTLFSGAFLLCAAGIAQADPVEYTDQAHQSIFGQDFTFEFDPAEASDGGGAIFTIFARGDYDNEWLDQVTYEDEGWFIEDVAQGSAGPQVGGTVVNAYDTGDWAWFQEFAISPGELDAILADGKIEIFIGLPDDIDQPFTNFLLGTPPNYNLDAHVGVIFAYESATSTQDPGTDNGNDPGTDNGNDVPGSVPEPSLLALTGAALGLLGLRRRRRSRR